MKIDIHSSVIGWLCSSELYNSLNEVVNRIAEMDGTVKKVQMYEDFLLPDDNYRFGKYPFMDDNRIYYPLTLIHRKNIWDIQWISWSRSNIRVQCPFSLVEEEKLEICKEVPSEFIDAIEGKEYIIKEIKTDDEELNAFLFSLGCYSGETITVVKKRRKGCTVSIKDGRYSIDNQLAEAILI